MKIKEKGKSGKATSGGCALVELSLHKHNSQNTTPVDIMCSWQQWVNDKGNMINNYYTTVLFMVNFTIHSNTIKFLKRKSRKNAKNNQILVVVSFISIYKISL